MSAESKIKDERRKVGAWRRHALSNMAHKFFWIGLLLFLGLIRSASADSGTPIPPIMQLEDSTASAVAWSPDGTQLAVGDANGISIYTNDLKLIRSMAQPTEEMIALDWSPDGKHIAAYGTNDVSGFDPKEPRQTTVYIWNPSNGQLITAFNKYTQYVPGLAWSPDGSRIATGGWDRIIHIWNPLNGVVQYTINAPEYPDQLYSNNVDALGWSSDGQLAAVIGDVGTFVWNDFTRDPRELIEHGSRYPHPYKVAWSPDAKFIALGIGIYDVEKGQEIDFKNCPGATKWSPDGKFTAIYAGDKGAIICNPFADVIVAVLQGILAYQDGGVLSYQNPLDWSPDGKLLAGAAGDGYVRIWDVSNLSTNAAKSNS